MEASCKKRCLTNCFLSLCMQLSCKSFLRTYFLTFCMELSCKSCLPKLFLRLLFGTVAQKTSCEAIPQGKTSISIPGRCDVLLSHGGGLGRSLNHVGRSQISLCIMLGRSVVHKLPFTAASEAFHGTVVQKLPSKASPQVWHGSVAQKLPFEAIS